MSERTSSETEPVLFDDWTGRLLIRSLSASEATSTAILSCFCSTATADWVGKPSIGAPGLTVEESMICQRPSNRQRVSGGFSRGAFELTGGRVASSALVGPVCVFVPLFAAPGPSPSVPLGQIRAMPAADSPSGPESTVQIYISNLPAGATSDRLESAFKQFGEVTASSCAS
jgi:hypothetical protein